MGVTHDPRRIGEAPESGLPQLVTSASRRLCSHCPFGTELNEVAVTEDSASIALASSVACYRSPHKTSRVIGLPIGSRRTDRASSAWTSMGQPASACCPIERTAALIGDRWTPLIVRDLAPGWRFSELQRSLGGISPKTLSDRLRRLEEAGIVTRACFAEMPPRVEYRLTDKGLRCSVSSRACASSA